MKIIAVDLGDARTGLAICDKQELLASPLTVLHQRDLEQVKQEIVRIATEQKAETIIVGYPKNMNNSIGERAEKCELFAKDLAAMLPIPVQLWDERSTTVSATQYLNTTNTRGKKRKNIVDAVAATIILESYLLWRKNHQPNKED